MMYDKQSMQMDQFDMCDFVTLNEHQTNSFDDFCVT